MPQARPDPTTGDDTMKLRVDGFDVYAYPGSRPFDASLPTIVFVHGGALDHSVWALQSRYFAHHGHNVFAVDLPAHGQSGGQALASVEAIAQWIVHVLDAFSGMGAGKAMLVGHSLGALAVLEAAARFPERVSRLAMIGPSVPMPVSDALLAAAEGNDHIAYEWITQWSFSAGHQLGSNQQPGMWMTGGALRLMERARPNVLHTDLLACQQYATGLEAAALVTCPVLMILGQRDLMAPPKNAQPLAKAMPHARVVTLPECGHSLMAEAPDAVLDALRVFVRQ